MAVHLRDLKHLLCQIFDQQQSTAPPAQRRIGTAQPEPRTAITCPEIVARKHWMLWIAEVADEVGAGACIADTDHPQRGIARTGYSAEL